MLGAAQDGSRDWITLIGSVCADGTTLPPAIIYQAISGNIHDSWLNDYNPEKHGCYITSTPSGWTSEELALSWLTKVFDCISKPKAREGRDWRLLIVDGHNSHINIRFLDWCDKHRVLVAVFPPHSTHQLQPLDVTCFRSLGHHYSLNLDKWQIATQGLTRLSKREFFSLFWPAF